MTKESSQPILEVDNVDMVFGGLRALDAVNLQVRVGDCFGIIGANGAGKTTLLNVITGYLRPTKGKIVFDGVSVTGKTPFQLAKSGMGRTFQITQPFVEMSVLENVMTGALFSINGRKRSIAEARAFCDEPLRLVGLADQAETLAGSLTLGAKKKLELARVLATEPKLMLLDEVMGGLTRAEVEEISEVLEKIRDSGKTTIVMIEHLVHVITRLCDHVYVLNFGRELFQGRPDDVIEHPEVIQAYLGKPQTTNAQPSGT
ncbi:MAG: ABC transporter ATP-binding protein [Rhizobiales bacterium]|nr:ABC transporter ATP-binding protein [Hyphomicrobiales bacterium]